MKVIDRVRRATPLDALKLESLRVASLSLLADETYEPAAIATLIRSDEGRPAGKGAPRVLVIERDGMIAAFGGWTRDGDAARISSLFVDPGFARTGLGTRLLAALEADAAASGFRRAVIRSTLNAMPFCTRNGYLPSRLAEIVPGEAPLGVEMAKSVADGLAKAA